MSSCLSKGKCHILMTGGTTGLGLSLAKKLVSEGHEVIVVSKYPERLENAKKVCPELIGIDGLVSTEEGRHALANKILTDFSQVNVIINNAGSTRNPPPLTETTDSIWISYLEVMNKTLFSRIHLASLLIPHLKVKSDGAMFVNVSTIAAYYPYDHDPVYSAAAAGVHSFTISLRHQLQNTSIKVVEIIPPGIETTKGVEWMRGVGDMEPDVYAQSVVTQLVAGTEEIGYD